MDSTKITRLKDGWHKNNSPNGWMVDSQMVGTKITRQRVENQIVSTKITRPSVGQCKNNSPKGWMSGELNGQHENNSPKDGESNSKHENNSLKGWTVQK